ncbi:mechanosensitive ion channel family protein [soil metagenome]
MSSIEETLAREYWGNSIKDYAIALGIILFGMIVVRIVKIFLARKLRAWVQKSANKVDDLAERAVEKFAIPIASLWLIYWGLSTLTLSPNVARTINVAISIAIAFFVIRLISSVIEYILSSYIRRQENAETKVKQVDGIMIIVNMVIWLLGGLFLFDNLGYNVSVILTGVGIGGIAIALAAQNIVGDLFNYFVIFFDKPFEVGDAIKVDDKNGTIEYIGIKTTRLRSLTGEQIIIANSDLTRSRVHNFKRQETRRISFNINILHCVPVPRLRKIPQIIQTIIEEQPETRFDRAHFARFTEYGLVFEVVYFMTIADYNKFMHTQQEINLKLMEIFEQQHIYFLIREDKPGKWDNDIPGSTPD